MQVVELFLLALRMAMSNGFELRGEHEQSFDKGDEFVRFVVQIAIQLLPTEFKFPSHDSGVFFLESSCKSQVNKLTSAKTLLLLDDKLLTLKIPRAK
jgi:hypothetical protein